MGKRQHEQEEGWEGGSMDRTQHGQDYYREEMS